jgi:DNA-binding response OmpR family regulator
MSALPETLSDTSYQLRPGLVVDLGSYEVMQGQTIHHLTPGEAELLAIVLEQPRHYVSVEKLIRLTRLRYARRPRRSLQETISDLHKKLGEQPRRPSLLRCLEGKAYALFPQSVLRPERKLVSGGQ